MRGFLSIRASQTRRWFDLKISCSNAASCTMQYIFNDKNRGKKARDTVLCSGGPYTNLYFMHGDIHQKSALEFGNCQRQAAHKAILVERPNYKMFVVRRKDR